MESRTLKRWWQQRTFIPNWLLFMPHKRKQRLLKRELLRRQHERDEAQKRWHKYLGE